jgi:hypothetical protein
LHENSKHSKCALLQSKPVTPVFQGSNLLILQDTIDGFASLSAKNDLKRVREVIGTQLKLFELIDNNVDMTLEEICLHFAKKYSLNRIHKLLKSPGAVDEKCSRVCTDNTCSSFAPWIYC